MKTPTLIAIFLGLGLAALASLWGDGSSVSYAFQATPRPTATNIGADSDDSDSEPPIILEGVVQGFVFDYSAGGAPQPGVGVVLDGGGWQAEMVTNSEGFYQFAGLGAGTATLNLRLPPGAHPVMPDWPVHTSNPLGTLTNLGYYWGDSPPLPVALSVTPESISVPANQEFEFSLQVVNQSGGVATEGVVDLVLPSALRAVSATASQGQVDFSEYRILGFLGEMANGQTATVQVKARFKEATAPQEATLRAILTYNEQLTPQVVQGAVAASEPVQLASVSSAAVTQASAGGQQPEAAQPSAEDESSQQADLPATGGLQTTDQAKPAQPATSANPDTGQPATGEEPIAGEVDEMKPADSAPVNVETGATPSPSEDLIPVTGTTSSPSTLATWLILMASITLIIGLGIAGLKTILR